MNDTNNNAKTILDAGIAMSGPHSANGDYAIIPTGYTALDLEKYQLAPYRKRGKVAMLDSPSFIAYTKKHGSLDNCVIYADVDFEASKFSIQAVINDHRSDVGGAQWRDFTVTMSPPLSVEYKRWLAQHNKQMSQIEFAAFVEENIGDIANVDKMPTGAQMLNMALEFQSNGDKRFKQKVNLQGGGVRLEYVDDEDKDTRSQMQFFERFTIGIPVFQGATSAYPIEARLKYRQSNGDMKFWYELVRPDRIFRAAVTDEINTIRDGTGFMVLNGRP
jgi:uncharacterized protein YfdQ (DUF2303 family)